MTNLGNRPPKAIKGKNRLFGVRPGMEKPSDGILDSVMRFAGHNLKIRRVVVSPVSVFVVNDLAWSERATESCFGYGPVFHDPLAISVDDPVSLAVDVPSLKSVMIPAARTPSGALRHGHRSKLGEPPRRNGFVPKGAVLLRGEIVSGRKVGPGYLGLERSPAQGTGNVTAFIHSTSRISGV